MRRAFASVLRRAVPAAARPSTPKIPSAATFSRAAWGKKVGVSGLGLVVAAGAGAAFMATSASTFELESETVKFDAGSVDDIKDGEMKEVDTGLGTEKNTKILLVRTEGKIVAIGDKCPHYGAPLAQGLLSGHRVLCPWHNASFCVNSGRVIDSPSLDGLPTYPVEIVNGRIIVTLPKGGPVNKSAVRPFVKRDVTKDHRTFVIVGAGAAGVTAAETLRQSGFQGRIIVITRESHLPYDRTTLSKNVGPEISKITLRDRKFWDDHDVEFMLDKDVIAVDAAAHEVRFRDGTDVHYDAALICTGARPRFPAIPGANFKNIFVVRTPEDSQAIKEAAGKAKTAVVIGSSFIGMETATSLKKNLGVKDVTIVGMEAVPLERILGNVVGNAVMKNIQETLGMKFSLGRSVVKFEGKNGEVTAVILDNGTRVAADMVVVGAGVVPETEFITGVRKTLDGGIVVDNFMRAAKDLYAAGDVACFPYWLTGDRIRIEHWNVAQQHGKIAARNMAGRTASYSSVPYFWCVLGGNKLNYVGHCDRYDDVVYEGDVDKLKFVAYYLQEDRVCSALAFGVPNAAPALAEAMRNGRMPTGHELRSGSANIQTIIRDAAPKNPACGAPNCPRNP